MIFQLHNYQITQSLPFSGFHQLFDFAFHQVALQGADVADVELAIEMIGFVKEGPGEEFLSGFFEDVTVNVLGADRDLVRARDVFAELRNAEASLALSVLAFGVNDFWVDQDQFGFGILFEGDVDYGDAASDADLRCRKADPVGFVHGLEHIFDQLLKFLIEDGDFLGGTFEDRVAELYDGIDHQ